MWAEPGLQAGLESEDMFNPLSVEVDIYYSLLMWKLFSISVITDDLQLNGKSF